MNTDPRGHITRQDPIYATERNVKTRQHDTIHMTTRQDNNGNDDNADIVYTNQYDVIKFKSKGRNNTLHDITT